MKHHHLLLAATLAAFTASSNHSAAQSDQPPAQEVKSIAGEAYAYCLPLVMAYTPAATITSRAKQSPAPAANPSSA